MSDEIAKVEASVQQASAQQVEEYTEKQQIVSGGVSKTPRGLRSGSDMTVAPPRQGHTSPRDVISISVDKPVVAEKPVPAARKPPVAAPRPDARELEGLRILDLASVINEGEREEEYAEREALKQGNRLAKTPRISRSTSFQPVVMPRRMAKSPRLSRAKASVLVEEDASTGASGPETPREEDEEEGEVVFLKQDMQAALEGQMGTTFYTFDAVSETRTVLFRVTSSDTPNGHKFVQATFAESSENNISCKLVNIVEFK